MKINGWLVIILLLLVPPMIWFSGCLESEEPDSSCELSLCDCKCYPKGGTPEETEGKLCGINCLGEYGVTGCETIEGECAEKHITVEESREIAEEYIKGAPTYSFDGFELEYVETLTLRCPFCWQYVYEFKSRHAGYGDRSGQVLAEVVTDHRITVTVIKGSVAGAIIDDRWDELKQVDLTPAGGGEKACETDADCACGTHVTTGDCFYGNKEYVDTSRQCPDYCMGIGGNLGIKCLEGSCEQVNLRLYCETESDCVPGQCCHPTSCVNRNFRPDCSEMMCTMVCQGPIDCGAGSCACVNNQCNVKSSGTVNEIK